ncbi:hypothetical protein FCV50_09885 [Vibrio kanaloae]|uniref:DNA-binding protein n=1 Tax=Vibrio kanaloae TaxID=170673 RepID=A0A4U1ZCB0_9VIBR|nr:hypothetical protein [Vibrio kanaloae]TKF32265.1 hypothetical protein FCV50_09885 [Vibrio kanaloae]
MDQSLLTAKELAGRIKFSANYINSTLRDSIFIEGKHYVRPFNGRKILYIWEEVEAELYQSASRNLQYIPMAGGRVCHG